MSGVGATISDALGMEAPPAPVFQPPPNPKTDDATAEKMRKAALAERKAKGRASTLLTGADGDTTQATVASKTLLGS